jgi:UDP-N-acetylmuramoyl-tripeptide--D-alanyl-D-alanine ligase
MDAYNANPASMKAAIENFAKIDAPKKMLMLGAMAELGPESITEHKVLVGLIQKHKWENVVLVGGDFEKTHENFLFFKNSSEAKNWLQNQLIVNTYILIKGSRSMQMEKLLY